MGLFYRVISDVDAQAKFPLAQMEADVSAPSSLVLTSPPELELCGRCLFLWIKKYISCSFIEALDATGHNEDPGFSGSPGSRPTRRGGR